MDGIDKALDGDEGARAALLKGVETGGVSWVHLVEGLEKYLTHEQPTFREQGTALLSHIITHCKPTTITDATVPVLVHFLCARIQDYTTANNCLRALSHLSDSDKLTDEHAHAIVTSLFGTLFVQSQPQPTRQLVFRLMTLLLNAHSAHLKTALGIEFVAGFLQQIDGEKDPRCLDIVFKLVPFVASAFPLGPYSEDMFEVTACYFPITFTPPPNDPYGITKEGLKSALMDCMCATPLFAPYCLDLLLDKVTTRIVEAKIDCFDGLARCAGAFGYACIQSSLTRIYTAVRQELFGSTDPNVHRAAVNALGACVAVMKKGHELRPIRSLWDEALHHLKDVDAGMTMTQGKMIIAACGASKIAAAELFKHYLPAAVETYVTTDNEQLRTAIAGVLSGMAQAYLALVSASAALEASESGDGSHNDSPHSLKDDPNAPKMEESESSKSGEALMRNKGKGVASLKQDAVEHFSKFITKSFEQGSDHVRSLAVYCMTALISLDSVDGAVVGEWLNSLLTLCQQQSNSLTRQALADTSNAIAEKHPTIASTVIQNLLASTSSTSSKSEFTELLHVIVSFGLASKECVGIFENFLACLYSNEKRGAFADVSVLAQSIASIFKQSKPQDAKLLISNCVSMTVAAVKDQHSASVGCGTNLEQVLDVLTDGLINCFTEKTTDLEKEEIIGLVDSTFTQEVLDVAVSHGTTSHYLWVLPATIGVLKREMSLLLDTPLLQRIRTTIDARLGHAPCPGDTKWANVEHLCAVYGSVLNKYSGQEASAQDKALQDKAITDILAPLEALVAPISAEGKQSMQEEDDDEEQGDGGPGSNAIAPFANFQPARLCLFAYVMRALIVAAHPQGAKTTEIALKMLLLDENNAASACDCLTLVLSGASPVLTKQTHAVYRLMYRQRFFQENTPRLISLRQKHSDKPALLKALSIVIRSVPKQVLMTQLASALPLILQSLDISDEDVLMTTLETLYVLLLDVPKMLEQYIDMLIDKLLVLSTAHKSLRVRKSALEALAVISGFSAHLVVPHAHRVLKALAKCVDDKKRLVRATAAHTRGKWYLVK